MELHGPTARSIRSDDVRRSILVFTSLAAGAIHAVVVPEHLRESLLFGAFFVATAVFQIGWAALLRDGGRDRGFLAIGAVANAGLILLWVVSRTVGVPVGPEPWMPEPKGPLDVTATILELVLVATALLWPVPRPPDRRDATG
jgi:hypothetical protein